MKLVNVVVLLVFCSILGASVIEHSYPFDNPQIQRSEDFDTVTFAQTLLTGITGEPTLPYRGISLLLPPGEEAVSIEIFPGRMQPISGPFNLSPAQPSNLSPWVVDHKPIAQKKMMVIK
jgi:hypothetical protein